MTVQLSSADRRRPWARRAAALELDCHCWGCLRAAGVTPDAGASIQHRRDVLGAGVKPSPAERQQVALERDQVANVAA